MFSSVVISWLHTCRSCLIFINFSCSWSITRRGVFHMETSRTKASGGAVMTKRLIVTIGYAETLRTSINHACIGLWRTIELSSARIVLQKHVVCGTLFSHADPLLADGSRCDWILSVRYCHAWKSQRADYVLISDVKILGNVKKGKDWNQLILASYQISS